MKSQIQCFKLLSLLLASIAVSGCSTSVNLFPIEGPLSKVVPLPSIVAKVDGIMSNSGNFDLELPNGEFCKGKWASVAPTVSYSGTLFGRYGQAANFNVTGIRPGVNRGEAFASCDKGTTIQAEFFTGSGTANGYGIARDSKSNVYKMIF